MASGMHHSWNGTRIRKSLTQYRIFSRLRQSMALPERLRWVRVSSLWAYRVLTALVLAAGLAFAGMVLALRYWILPNVEAYRGDIARIVSERARQRVTIGSIQADWDGLRPRLVLQQVTVHDAAGRPALEFARIDNTLSWASLPALELRFHALDIHRPTLSIRRDESGALSVGGIETGGGEAGGFAEWLLRQRDVEIHEATIVWNDERRKAPPLDLKNVSFRLLNSGGHHRFGLRATPPRDLAAPLDLRGDLRGGSLKSLADWDGELFLQLDYVDIAAWRTWVPFPVHFPRGAGALRAWLTFSRDRLVEIVADVRLANVLTRLADDLPQLEVAELNGRVGWKRSNGGFEVSTTRLGLATKGGLTLPPADFLLRVTAGDGRRPARGELRASVLALEPLVSLADHLPLAREMRRQLAEYSPRGRIAGAVLHWTGEWREPKEYSIRGRFQNVALKPVGRVPGFRGVTGTLEANERGGVLALSSRKAAVEMPLVFRDIHQFDALNAQVSWTRGGGETEVKLNSVAFSNAHVAGTVIGVYRTAGATAGRIDLTGTLTRADARYAARYIPLMVAKSARDWLDAAFISGASSHVTLRLKGALDDFPFPGGRGGVFQVAARVTGGTLHYADGWPRIGGIAGDLVFRGGRMDVYARQGTIYGVRLARVHVAIPNLLEKSKVLDVTGEAEGRTADFLRFIETSPVLGMIDHFTEGWEAQGSGRLALQLSIPLADAAKSKVAGSYQFAANSVTAASLLPPVEQAAGRVEFTESGVRVPGIKGSFLGGPVSITAATTRAREAAVRVDVQGRINADIARRDTGPAWVQKLRGAADWRAQLVTRGRTADIVMESTLQGLAVDFPAPLVKSASQSLPVRFERRILPAGRDRVSFSAGNVASMILVRRIDGGNATVVRGDVRFGSAAVEPVRGGLWVSGAVKEIDADRWLALLEESGRGGARVESGGVDLRLGTLDALGRRFGELAIRATIEDGQWRIALSGAQLDGTVAWQPAGAGRLVARMNTLAIPAASPGGEAASSEPGSHRNLPELDIVAAQFINKGRNLGRLEVVALPDDRAWRIERLRLSSPESTFTVDGSWQFGDVQPRTRVKLRVEASDVGKLLARFGQPEGVKGGTATLEGSLTWAGAPYDFDVPSLAGTFSLRAAKGQFAKLDPGIGKLLGVMSLQSLPRRMALDFNDVFSEGFAFDEIAGTMRFDRGTAATDDLRIHGPAAHVVMSGDVDLVQETQNLRVRITPQVMETVSVAGALIGGPIAGVAAYLAQQALKDPVGKFVTFEYGVTGNWSNPVVKRIPRGGSAPPPEAPPG
jgi:uncharacterized protein (TIGR02099 family)